MNSVRKAARRKWNWPPRKLTVKVEGSKLLGYTGLCVGMEHLKIKTRLIDERFPRVMGECAIVTLMVLRL